MLHALPVFQSRFRRAELPIDTCALTTLIVTRQTVLPSWQERWEKFKKNWRSTDMKRWSRSYIHIRRPAFYQTLAPISRPTLFIRPPISRPSLFIRPPISRPSLFIRPPISRPTLFIRPPISRPTLFIRPPISRPSLFIRPYNKWSVQRMQKVGLGRSLRLKLHMRQMVMEDMQV